MARAAAAVAASSLAAPAATPPPPPPPTRPLLELAAFGTNDTDGVSLVPLLRGSASRAAVMLP